MINIECLAHNLELETKQFDEICISVPEKPEDFDGVVLMNYFQNFRCPETIGVFLRGGEYNMLYRGSVFSARDSLLNPRFDRIRKKSLLLSGFNEIAKGLIEVQRLGPKSPMLQLYLYSVNFKDAEQTMFDFVDIFKIRTQCFSLIPDIEYVSEN